MSIPKSNATKTPAAPPVVEKEKKEAASDVREVSTAQLREMRDAIRLELRRREQLAEELRPKKGETVRIKAPGRFHNKVGTIVISRKTRAFVEVEGAEMPAYVLHSHLERVTK